MRERARRISVAANAKQHNPFVHILNSRGVWQREDMVARGNSFLVAPFTEQAQGFYSPGAQILWFHGKDALTDFERLSVAFEMIERKRASLPSADKPRIQFD